VIIYLFNIKSYTKYTYFDNNTYYTNTGWRRGINWKLFPQLENIAL